MPVKAKLVVGQKYGRLTVVREIKYRCCTYHPEGRIVLFRCDCGAEVKISFKRARSGNTSSCGCLRREMVAKKNTKHGFGTRENRLPEYTIWKRMRQRCNDPNNHEWENYGGRGITICKRWDAFEVFLKDVGRRPSKDYSLDRYPDMNGNYEPGNVRWATTAQQARNKRNTVWVTYENTTYALADLADKLGVPYNKLYYKFRRSGSVS